jgi:hypothetical protein
MKRALLNSKDVESNGAGREEYPPRSAVEGASFFSNSFPTSFPINQTASSIKLDTFGSVAVPADAMLELPPQEPSIKGSGSHSSYDRKG